MACHNDRQNSGPFHRHCLCGCRWACSQSWTRRSFEPTGDSPGILFASAVICCGIPPQSIAAAIWKSETKPVVVKVCRWDTLWYSLARNWINDLHAFGSSRLTKVTTVRCAGGRSTGNPVRNSIAVNPFAPSVGVKCLGDFLYDTRTVWFLQTASSLLAASLFFSTHSPSFP